MGRNADGNERGGTHRDGGHKAEEEHGQVGLHIDPEVLQAGHVVYQGRQEPGDVHCIAVEAAPARPQPLRGTDRSKAAGHRTPEERKKATQAVLSYRALPEGLRVARVSTTCDKEAALHVGH